MSLELVSFNLCPYVQRSVITLLYKGVEHSITYIDLDDRPQWFIEMSPLGKVPLLRVDGSTVLFESAVINEYVDETTPPALHPAEPLRRAANRAWTEFGGSLLESQYRMVYLAKTEQDCLEHRDKLVVGLERLESELGEGPFFNGPQLSLIDTSYAPLFMHIATANGLNPLIEFDELPKVKRWSDTMLALPAVRDSVISDFDEVYRQSLQRAGTYYSGFA